MLAVIAGGSIGLGALYYTIIVSDAELSFATGRVLADWRFRSGSQSFWLAEPSCSRETI
jgi:hypothetical protein